MRGNILVIDDDEKVFHRLKKSLKAHNIHYISDLRGVNDIFVRRKIDLAIVDLNLNDNKPDEHFSGLDYLKKINDRFPEVVIMVLSSYRDVDRVSTAIHNGADVYEWKTALNVNTTEFRKKINRLIKGKKKADEAREALKSEIWGRSPAIDMARSQIEQYAKSLDSFFLVGEKGTPKENAIQYLHFKAKAYADTREQVSVDLSKWDEEEIDQVLRTRPESKTKTFLKQANNNILLLDNFDTIPFRLQEIFLEMCKKSRYFRSRTPLHTQFVFGLMDTPAESQRSGNLSPALLQKFPLVHFTPLRERKIDVEGLIDKWLHTYGYQPHQVSADIRTRFLRYDYPNNEEELFDLVSQMMRAHRNRYERRALFQQKSVEWQDVPTILNRSDSITCDLKFATARFELGKIEKALNHSGGKKEEAAHLLGIKNADLLKKSYVRKYADRYPLLVQEFPLIAKLYKING